MEPTPNYLNELKAIETDMLRVLVDICQQLNLRYYLLGGTLLGAVRHQGFIPWDDDIDVGMPRADYEILLKKAPALLPEKLFLQDLASDPPYPMCFAKLRNSSTTFLESSIAHLPINHGIYIDIFPLDNYPEQASQQQKLAGKLRYLNARISTIYHFQEKAPLKTRFKLQLLKLLYPSVKQTIRMREKLYRSVPASDLTVNHGGAWGKKEIVPTHWYGDGTPVTFEGLQVNAPTHYHQWLTQVYGDYMQLPPEEKRVTHHYTDVIDPHKPYTEYVRTKK